MKEKTLSVSAIKDGTVIDHITAGAAFKIIKLLRLTANGNRVTVGLNLKSSVHRLKDIIKTENTFLSEAQYAQIAVFAPNATVNIIRNYEVIKKFKVQMPEAVASVLTCANSRCITNLQKVSTLFIVEENNTQVLLRCKHCEKLFSREQMHEKL
jgi:aspartate carbamoyltransferase regulatory subunit